ncbi:hypothetical protein Pfo_025768 [Paulownia fortunei]|nr:hypothetical protein Pfo_025768 [Paulownia fortunei]
MLETVKYLMGSAGRVVSLKILVLSSVMTGATSGIGAETARVLAMRGARLVLPARSVKAAEDTKARIVSEFPESEIIVMSLDLSSLNSVRRFVAEFESLNLSLNLLINNAGKFSYDHGISEDGIEMTFATNYLGHFLLTKLLLEKMIETAEASGVQGRIVNVSSSIHTWFSGDIIRYLGLITKNKSQYDGTRAYALSKLANVLHTKELALRLKASLFFFFYYYYFILIFFSILTQKEMKANVTVNCVHPGIVRTRLTRDREGLITDLVFFLASKLLKTIPQAAATTCYVATDPKLVNISGKYYSDCNEASTSKMGSSLSESARLWAASEILVSTDSKAVFDPFNPWD